MLATVSAGQVGAVAVDLQGHPRITSAGIHDMPPETAPNPSIAGTVDFVLSEARYYLKMREDSAWHECDRTLAIKSMPPA